MSRDFKLKFDDFKDNNPSEEKESEGNKDHYSTPGHVRNLTFVWPDGKMQSFNYSYLVTMLFTPGDNLILLEFTSHTIQLKGVRLEELFSELILQTLKIIRKHERRYDKIEGNTDSIVSDIVITAK